MKKIFVEFAAVTAMLLVASCGNKSGNAEVAAATETAAEPETETLAETVDPAEPTGEVAYESFTFERFGVSFDVLKGMTLKADPATEDFLSWTLVPETDQDMPFYASQTLNVTESMTGEYDKQKIQESFDNVDYPDKKLDLGNNEFTYSIKGDEVNEFHRVLFKGKFQANFGVIYAPRWEKRLGGEICKHILSSAKFN
jgi:hypothetical protein